MVIGNDRIAGAVIFSYMAGGNYPQEMKRGPYKKGYREDPANYRGVVYCDYCVCGDAHAAQLWLLCIHIHNNHNCACMRIHHTHTIIITLLSYIVL